MLLLHIVAVLLQARGKYIIDADANVMKQLRKYAIVRFQLHVKNDTVFSLPCCAGARQVHH
jgi:hypothetical protein